MHTISEAVYTARQIASLSAFTILGATRRRRINQHCTRYTFGDGSELTLYTSGRWVAVPDGGLPVVGNYRATATG